MSNATFASLDGVLDGVLARIGVPPFAAAAVVGLLLVAILWRRVTPPAARKPVPPKSDIIPLDGFEWRTEERRVFRPFKPIYHITMGLTNSTPSELITIDCGYADRVAQRRKLVQTQGRGVYGVVPDGRGAAAVRELYEYLLRDHLPRRFPTMFTLSPDGAKFTNVTTGRVLPTSVEQGDAAAEQALRDLAETVEEDLFFLHRAGDTHQCVAFACCFPSGFDPSSKLGQGLSAIHAPVPSYDRIGPSMERFFARLEAGKPVRRLNWSVQTHNELYNCAGNHIITEEDEKTDEPVDISKTNLRIEMQTLTRLPRTEALLFSFKTYLTPVADIKAEGKGPEMADAIEGLQKGNAPGMWRYKAAVRWGLPVMDFLRS